MRVSIYWLTQATEKHRGTVKKRVAGLDADKHGRYDSAAALEAIYCGAAPGDNGEFISTPEAVRQLTLAKKTQIELQNAKFREEFYPREFVHFWIKHAFLIVTATLKGNVNRLLTVETVNDIFDQVRSAFTRMQEDGDKLENEYEAEKEEKAQAANRSGVAPGTLGSNRIGNDQSIPATVSGF